MKKKIKLGGIVFFAGIVENLIMLAVFQVPLNKQTIILTAVFSVILTLIIDKFILGEN